MSETLLEKLDRIESELKKIQSIKPPKPIRLQQRYFNTRRYQ